MVVALRGVVGVVGVVLLVAGLAVIASKTFPIEGLWLVAMGLAGIVVMLLERGRYRAGGEASSSGAVAPGARFKPTDEIFVDPTSGQRTRVLIDPASGERRYEPEP